MVTLPPSLIGNTVRVSVVLSLTWNPQVLPDDLLDGSHPQISCSSSELSRLHFTPHCLRGKAEPRQENVGASTCVILL